jgi:hypothetical protein
VQGTAVVDGAPALPPILGQPRSAPHSDSAQRTVGVSDSEALPPFPAEFCFEKYKMR